MNDLSLMQVEQRQFDLKTLPTDLRNNLPLVYQLRKIGYLETLFKGYDVIRDVFFCKELLFVEDWAYPREFEVLFDTFAEYLSYINDTKLLSEKACYYQCTKERCEIESFPKKIQSTISKAIIACAFNPSIDYQMENDIISMYKEEQKTKTQEKNTIQKDLQMWIKVFSKAINDEKKLYKTFLKYAEHRNDPSTCILDYYLMYILRQICSLDIHNYVPLILFDMIEKELLTSTDAYHIIPFYPAELLLELYKDRPSYSEATLKKHRREFTKAINAFSEPQIPRFEFFRYNSHDCMFTCTAYYSYKQKIEYHRYLSFLSLEEMEEFTHLDLHSKVALPTTFDNEDVYEVRLTKEYQTRSNKGLFVVTQSLIEGEKCLYQKTFETPYLFDLIHYLDKDLSGINLILCDGLDNVSQLPGINLTGAQMQSKHAQKFSIPIEEHPFVTERTEINAIYENELTVIEQEYIEPHKDDEKDIAIKYISDLHLIHRIQNNNCKTIEDVTYLLTQIAREIAPSWEEILVIAGDTSSDFKLFQLFTDILNKYRTGDVIFTLGNHELWHLNNQSQNKNLYQDYQQWFKSFSHQFLLQNDLLYIDEHFVKQIITEAELQSYSVTALKEKLTTARCIFFGGLAFAGNNPRYNADAGLYKDIVTRQEEVEYSQQFANLYHKILPILQQHQSIVITHMPLTDWDTSWYVDNIFYISGHTHHNYFYDDGVTKIYADNQIGYKNKKINAKQLFLSPVYDFFYDKTDGVHEITKEDYIKFMNGRNIHMNFTRDVHQLYVVKKMGYYCFIHVNKKGVLSILNGGQQKNITEKTIQSVYNKMDSIIARINTPLTQYYNLQKQIANAIKKIGGSGRIHGCIIDIDFFSHLFVMPDGRAVPYYAYDMIYKVVFPSLQSLLQEHQPALHDRYLKLIETKESTILPAIQLSTNRNLCLETEIYKISKEIKKMQRLQAGILSYWDDTLLRGPQPLALPPTMLTDK